MARGSSLGVSNLHRGGELSGGELSGGRRRRVGRPRKSQKVGGARMNPWVAHVKRYMYHYKVPYAVALVHAADSYKHRR